MAGHVQNAQDAQLALEAAIEARDLALVSKFVTAGIDLNHRDDGGWTPLHKAVAAGDLPIVKTLLDAGADPTLEDNAAWTPAMHAELYSFDEAVTLLEESVTQH